MIVNQAHIARAIHDIEYFNTHIFPHGFNEPIVPAPHTNKWVVDLADNSHVAILSARKHLKSVSVYSYLMWKLLRCQHQDYECFYFSYNADIASYHTANIKKLIMHNPYFAQVQDLTPASGILKYSWDGNVIFEVRPQGMTSFKRGLHPNEVICDDILADPTSELNLTVIEKINTIFFKEVMSLPKEPGLLKLVGTSQTSSDLFFQIKKKSTKFKWDMYKAIKDWEKKKVLWPELFPMKRLMEIRDEEIGEKAFSQEYMCSPVHSEKAYFRHEQIERIINPGIGNVVNLRTDNRVLLGWDIGKKRHPSHVAIFEQVGRKYVQRLSFWMDQWDYTRQIAYIKNMCEELNVDLGYWDATRGEFDTMQEQGAMPDCLLPMIFTKKSKNSMAAIFERLVNTKRVELIDDERQTSQILSVNNDLQAIETPMGHGDSFWSVAMGLFAGEYEENIINW